MKASTPTVIRGCIQASGPLEWLLEEQRHSWCGGSGETLPKRSPMSRPFVNFSTRAALDSRWYVIPSAISCLHQFCVDGISDLNAATRTGQTYLRPRHSRRVQLVRCRAVLGLIRRRQSWHQVLCTNKTHHSHARRHARPWRRLSGWPT
eukprot:COSAG02_NODE_192_length_29942_cov_34.627228_12_plen_149_part_00